MQALLLQSREDESIDRRPHRSIVRSERRQWRPDRLAECPVRSILRALFDPLSERGDVRGLHWFGFALRRLRHQVVRVFRLDALNQFALLRVAGHDRIWMPRTLFECRFAQVQPQSRLAHLGIGPVTTEAIAGQDRLHVLVKINLPRALITIPVLPAGCDSRP